MSNIEQEAERFMADKRKAFDEGLETGCDQLSQFLKDNLWNSHELEKTLDKLIEVELWAKKTADKYSIR